MRVGSIKVENFAGLGHLDLGDLESMQDVIVSGRNGIGKSQLLLAIAIAWRGISPTDGRKFIGPAAPSASIAVKFVLSDAEREELLAFARSHGIAGEFSGATIERSIRIDGVTHYAPETRDEQGNASISMVLQNTFAREHLSFAEVVYLPADRTVQRTPDINLTLRSLSRGESLTVSDQALNQAVSEWSQPHQFDVFASLASLDYAGYLQRNVGEAPLYSEDFAAITEGFLRATGKSINKPALQPDGSIAMRVSLPDGTDHSISTLSTGELVALQLMHFVRRHARQGSVLLADEPEQHLHPSLQAEIVELMRTGSTAGQLWMATHSPAVLSAAGPESMLVLSRDPVDHTVGAIRVSSEDQMVELFGELGVSPGLWVPGNVVLIVEGSTDVSMLRRLLPIETSRAYFIVAGDSSSVASVAHRMVEASNVPFVAIRDRDLASIEARGDWMASPNRFMWSGYAIESNFLDFEWIHRTLAVIEPGWTVDAVKSELARVSDDQRPGLKKRWLEEQVIRRIPSRDDHTRELTAEFAERSNVALERGEYLEREGAELEAEFDALWEREWSRLVEPKRAFRSLRQNVFANSTVFMNAMIKALEDDPGLMPPDLDDLRALIAGTS